MIDAAKYADLVLLLVDGAFGFEMETFEFLNILQAWIYCIAHFKSYWDLLRSPDVQISPREHQH